MDCSPSTARPATPRSSAGPHLELHGTVLADGETLDSPRVQAAAGPGNALAYHAAYEFGGDVTTLPAGDVWLDAINQSPPQDRHLAVHDQHLIALNHADTAAWAAGSWRASRPDHPDRHCRRDRPPRQ